MSDEKIRSREELEHELKGLKDRLAYAVETAKYAKLLLDLYVIAELKKTREFRVNYAAVEAVAKETPMAGPSVAMVGNHYGMKRAAEIALEMSRRGGEEWHAACKAVAEELTRRTE